MCGQEFDELHLDRVLAQSPWGIGEDRLVYRCGAWVVKRERDDRADNDFTNRFEHKHLEEARAGALPSHIRLPRTRLVVREGEELLAMEFIDGVSLRACERLWGAHCDGHPSTCVSLGQMREIRDTTGLYDFAEGNVIRNEGGLYLVDMTLCDRDQPLDFEWAHQAQVLVGRQ